MASNDPSMMDKPLDWASLLNPNRRKKPTGAPSATPAVEEDDNRTAIERDADRILFCTPVRRLGDKTQVFPLEQHDSVRNRLTHSHEVAALARSIGTRLAFGPLRDVIDPGLRPQRDLPAMLFAIGLVHDLGNPPFGHQGERAIQQWFERKSSALFTDGAGLSLAMQKDFLKFDGNAQTFRLVARLQLLNDDRGLNLTLGTLAALLKYTVPSDRANKDDTYAGAKKAGFFQSESHIVEEVRRETGIAERVRHPLTYIMEACDDIAYSVVDAEDAVKKALASFPDLEEFLRASVQDEPQSEASTLLENVLSRAADDRNKLRGSNLSPGETNDVSMQKFRAYAMTAMVGAVSDAFVANLDAILKGRFEGDLISASRASLLSKSLKKFDRRVAYNHRNVLGLEARGAKVIHELMDVFWRAICDRADRQKPVGPRLSAESAYVYALISENYRRVFESPNVPVQPVLYGELQLLTDMIAGMTDSFAMSLHQEFASRGLLRVAAGG